VPEHCRGFDAPAWLLVGQTGMVEYLTQRPQAAVSSYDQNHPVALPFLAELDPLAAITTTSSSGAAAAVAPSGGNLPEGSAPIDVDMAAKCGHTPCRKLSSPVCNHTCAPHVGG
jgi:hypothetical protein